MVEVPVRNPHKTPTNKGPHHGCNNPLPHLTTPSCSLGIRSGHAPPSPGGLPPSSGRRIGHRGVHRGFGHIWLAGHPGQRQPSAAWPANRAQLRGCPKRRHVVGHCPTHRATGQHSRIGRRVGAHERRQHQCWPTRTHSLIVHIDI